MASKTTNRSFCDVAASAGVTPEPKPASARQLTASPTAPMPLTHLLLLLFMLTLLLLLRPLYLAIIPIISLQITTAL
jgi:hypothetical protein